MRLTADLIQRAPYYVNPLHQIEITLRGHSIQIIENLGVIPTECQVIDLSYNSIRVLENFPKLSNVVAIYANHNQLLTLAITNNVLPELHTLNLQHNQFTTLQSIATLIQFTKLTHLIISQNPIASHPLYRSFLVFLLPSLQMLDYQKVSQKERNTSIETIKKYLPQDADMRKLDSVIIETLIENINKSTNVPMNEQ